MKKLFACLGLLLMAACDQQGPLIRVVPTNPPVARAQDPEAVQMLPVQFRVVTAQTLDGFLAEMRQQQSSTNPVFIAITTRDYENLALNIADLRRYIEQQQAVIVYYRNMSNGRN